MRALMNNSKTLKSLDLTTVCPRLSEGNPCAYCYVNASRNVGFNAKKICDSCDYDHDILRLRPETIERLRGCGGLRVFSFADYYPWMDTKLEEVISDAEAMELPLKAITKQVDFVHKYANRFALVHVSVDNIGDGVDWDVAKELRETYPSVRIRAVVTKHKDLEALSWVDVITLNHGRNGFHAFTKKEMEEVRAKYPGKVCCSTGNCETCDIKCGG